MSSYVRALVAVSVLIVEKNKVLALKRSEHSDAAAGKWETISGRVQVKESLLEAARREAFEETALHVELEERPLLSYLAKRAEQDMVVVVYRGRVVSGEIAISEEHSEFRWVDLDGFSKLCEFDQLVEAVGLALSAP
ncbi:MAG: NUDIX domain-containing protein [Myxococcales bacterium]|nr:MAG: NUDIX domain-containing protein [Myxococcales bacterium]